MILSTLMRHRGQQQLPDSHKCLAHFLQTHQCTLQNIHHTRCYATAMISEPVSVRKAGRCRRVQADDAQICPAIFRMFILRLLRGRRRSFSCCCCYFILCHTGQRVQQSISPIHTCSLIAFSISGDWQCSSTYPDPDVEGPAPFDLHKRTCIGMNRYSHGASYDDACAARRASCCRRSLSNSSCNRFANSRSSS